MIELVEYLVSALVPDGDYTVEMREGDATVDIVVIIAKKDYLYLNYLEKNVNKALVFNAQGFYKLLAGEDLEDEVVHGQFRDPQ